MSCRIVVLISGTGRNLQALLDAAASDNLAGATIVKVISNRPGVLGLERAENAGVPTQVVDHKDFDSRESFDTALAEVVEAESPDIVVLAGFMRILTPEFVSRFAGKMLNIHPSLLPKYRGINTHQRALDAGDHEHGLSIHFVTEELDGGPVILQATVPIDTGDTAQDLANKVMQRELVAYPEVVRWLASGRLHYAQPLTLDGCALTEPKCL